MTTYIAGALTVLFVLVILAGALLESPSAFLVAAGALGLLGIKAWPE